MALFSDSTKLNIEKDSGASEASKSFADDSIKEIKLRERDDGALLAAERLCMTCALGEAGTATASGGCESGGDQANA
jgi:hypothetical protein